MLFIADEVRSAYSRAGKLFAIEHFGVVPDIMTMAKGIAGGWPLRAFIAHGRDRRQRVPGGRLSQHLRRQPRVLRRRHLQSRVPPCRGSTRPGDAQRRPVQEALKDPQKTQPLISDQVIPHQVSPRRVFLGTFAILDELIPSALRKTEYLARHLQRACPLVSFFKQISYRESSVSSQHDYRILLQLGRHNLGDLSRANRQLSRDYWYSLKQV